jgi:hypothetical protein
MWEPGDHLWPVPVILYELNGVQARITEWRRLMEAEDKRLAGYVG